jgi:TPR repeat protein
MSMTRTADVEDHMLRGIPQPQQFLQLGLLYSTGESVPTDMVAAHKWFNIAALRGCSEAIRHRCEIAEEMSSAEIAAAQRAARDWITKH